MEKYKSFRQGLLTVAYDNETRNQLSKINTFYITIGSFDPL